MRPFRGGGIKELPVRGSTNEVTKREGVLASLMALVGVRAPFPACPRVLVLLPPLCIPLFKSLSELLEVKRR